MKKSKYPKKMFFEEQEYIPKQPIISFLKGKIKEYEEMYVDNDEALIVLQKVLDFVNKGGKEWNV